jgi:hypothetical protein
MVDDVGSPAPHSVFAAITTASAVSVDGEAVRYGSKQVSLSVQDGELIIR